MGFRGSRVQIPPSRLAPAEAGALWLRRALAAAARCARGIPGRIPPSRLGMKSPMLVANWSDGLSPKGTLACHAQQFP